MIGIGSRILCTLHIHVIYVFPLKRLFEYSKSYWNNEIFEYSPNTPVFV